MVSKDGFFEIWKSLDHIKKSASKKIFEALFWEKSVLKNHNLIVKIFEILNFKNPDFTIAPAPKAQTFEKSEVTLIGH